MTNYMKFKYILVDMLEDYIYEYGDCKYCVCKEFCEKQTDTKYCPTLFRRWFESEVEDND